MFQNIKKIYRFKAQNTQKYFGLDKKSHNKTYTFYNSDELVEL